ncbi:MAG TPA: 50S ribosomal protein L21 [bacterium]
MEKYVIVKHGGKQYRVAEGDVVYLEKVDANSGDVVTINDVLFYKDKEKLLIGRPVLTDAAVTCEVIGNVRGKKVIAFKKKRRKNYKKTIGHRQNYTEVKIKEIKVGA